MSDDWLWSGGEPPDPEEAKRIAALRTLRRDRQLPKLPARPRQRWPWVAATVALAAMILAFVLWPRSTAWQVQALSGARPCAWIRCRAEVGQTLTPGPGDRWRVDLGEQGEVVLDGDAALTRLPGDGLPLRLDHGHATFTSTAPAGALRVDTPSAGVVDLGCAYELHVHATSTLLVVTDGTVALELPTGKALVTGGSRATAILGRAPPLPVRVDAAPGFAAAAAADDVDGMLALARPQDDLTLWHVLQRVPAADRPRVLDRIVAVGPAHCAPDPFPLLMLDENALKELWQELAPTAASNDQP